MHAVFPWLSKTKRRTRNCLGLHATCYLLFARVPSLCSDAPLSSVSHGTAPPYLAETLQLTSDTSTRRHLRSAATPTLVVPSTRRTTTLGDQAFPVATAHAWNALPSSLRTVPSLTSFRRRLKTELFDQTFSQFLLFHALSTRVFLYNVNFVQSPYNSLQHCWIELKCMYNANQ